MNASVFLVVALSAEAAPLIRHFELVRLQSNTDVPIYTNGQLWLAISGIGKQGADKAIETLNEHGPKGVSAWLNIGIAGHGTLNVGEGFLANRINDQVNSDRWYPIFAFQPVCKTDSVTTVEEVENRYPDSTGYDMEASGFFRSAICYSTAELVHCYKVVSDNPSSPTTDLTTQIITQLIQSRLPDIENIVDALKLLAVDLADRKPSEHLISPFLNRWNFTVTQKHQLTRLLRKSNTLGIDIQANSDALRFCQNAKSVIQIVGNTVNSYWHRTKISDVPKHLC